jgi:hypothetical protein
LVVEDISAGFESIVSFQFLARACIQGWRTHLSNVRRTFLLSAKLVLAHSTCAVLAACIARLTSSAVLGLIPLPSTRPSAGQ